MNIEKATSGSINVEQLNPVVQMEEEEEAGQMFLDEEREKKHVLYTVVGLIFVCGDPQKRTSVRIWLIRGILIALLLIALAVVSLRSAQTGDPEKVIVFQSIHVPNHTNWNLHQHPDEVSHVNPDYFLQLPHEEDGRTSTESELSSEVVVTSNPTVKQFIFNHTDGISTSETTLNLETTPDHNLWTLPTENQTETLLPDTISTAPVTTSATNMQTKLAIPTTASATTKAGQRVKGLPENSAKLSKSRPKMSTESVRIETASPTDGRITPSTSITSVTGLAPNATASSITSSLPPSHTPHRLVHVATSASGNHVGGFCVWKVNAGVVRWSYFFANIPVEYQSRPDSTDLEMRALIAAVRTWSSSWDDNHVVLRSQHPSVKGSNHATRVALGRELARLSSGHFTYEFEQRLKKTDPLVSIASSLGKLHRDYAHWFRTFQRDVDSLLGQQDWLVVEAQNRAEVAKSAFLVSSSEDNVSTKIVSS